MLKTAKLGAYEIGHAVGRGGSAMVYEGRHAERGWPVAVKVLTSQASQNGFFLASFRAEARAVAILHHPNVVRLLDQGEVNEDEAYRLHLPAGAPYLVSELVQGGPLRHQAITPTRLLTVLDDLLAGLAYVHARGLVHRDLKPTNVLVDSTTGAAKLTDFGLVQKLDPRAPLRFEGNAAGTPNYMSPEQAAGRVRQVGPWTDLYSLGCLAWTLSTGQAPFHHPNPREVIRRQLRSVPPRFVPRIGVPAGFEGWLLRLLEKRPGARYPSAADARWALAEIARGHPLPREVQGPPLAYSWRRETEERAVDAVGGLALLHMREAPFQGRERERDRLWRALRRVCAEGSPRAILLRGSAGSGKTRLAEWLAREAHERGAAFSTLISHSPEGGPLDGVEGALTRRWRTHGLSAEAHRQQVKRRLEMEGVRDPAAHQAALQLLSPSDAPDAAQVRPEQRWALLHRALERDSQGRAALLVLDDLQWGEDSLQLANHLLHRAAPLPLLIVMIVQDEALASRPLESARVGKLGRAPDVETLRVQPLTPQAQVRFLRGLVDLDEGLAAQIAERTQGSPQFAVLLLQDWLQRGWLKPGPSGPRLLLGAGATLPDSVYSIWRAQLAPVLESLDPDARVALELAAILGSSVDADEWARVCAQVKVETATMAVDALTRLALAEELEGGWRWVHAMVRESVERLSQDAGRAARLHRACAEVLGERLGVGLHERVSRHLLAAGDTREGLRALLDATEEMHNRGLGDRADATLERARSLANRELGPRDTLRGRLLSVEAARQTAKGRTTEALEMFELAEAHFRRVGADEERFKVLMRMTWLQSHLGRSDAGGEALRQAEALLPDAAPGRQLAQFHHTRSVWHKMRGEYPEAREAAELGLAALSDTPPERAERWRAFLNVALADALHRQGELDTLEPLYIEAVEVWRRLYRHISACNALNSLGEVYRSQGRLEDARRTYEEAVKLCITYGLPDNNRAVPSINLSILRILDAQPEPACALLREVLEMPGVANFAPLLGYVRLGLATCAAQRGVWDAHDEHLDVAADIFERTRITDPDVPLLLGVCVQAAEAAEEPDRAARARALQRGSTGHT